MTTRAAGPGDVIAVHELRDRYYSQRGEPVQCRPDALFWVAEHGETIVACQSYAQVGNECWVMDSYTDGTPAGARGLASLSHRIAEHADANGLFLLGMVHMNDDRMIRHSLARGWQLSAVVLARAPHPKAEAV